MNMHDPKTCDQNGEKLGNLRIKDCVEEGKRLFEWEEAVQEQKRSAKENGRYRIGVGMAAAPHGSSLFGIMPDTCGVMLKMNEDGSATMFTGVSDMGNGSNTTQLMLVSEITGISMDRIACVKTDTETTLFDVGAYASRGTYVGGNAALKAAVEMQKKIMTEAKELLEIPEDRIELGDNKAWESGNEEHCNHGTDRTACS